MNFFFWFLIFVYNRLPEEFNTVGNDWALLVYLFFDFDFLFLSRRIFIQNSFSHFPQNWIASFLNFLNFKCLCPINNVIIIVDGNCCCWMMMMMVDYHKNIIIIGRMVGHFFWFFKIFQFFDFWFSVVQRCLQEKKTLVMLVEKCWSNEELRKKFLKKQKTKLVCQSLDKFIYYNFGLWSLISEFFSQARNSKQKPNNHHHQFFCNSFIGQKKFFQRNETKNFRVSIRSKHTTNTGRLLRWMPGLKLDG